MPHLHYNLPDARPIRLAELPVGTLFQLPYGSEVHMKTSMRDVSVALRTGHLLLSSPIELVVPFQHPVTLENA